MGEVLQYLVPVEPRRKVLKALLCGVEGSVQAVADTCLLPYATAHRELKRMSGAGLVTSRRVGNQRHFHLNEAHPTVDHLKALVRADLSLMSRDYTQQEAELLRQLVELGAPMAVTGKPNRRGEVYSTLVRGAKFARRDYMVTRTLPIAFVVQKEKKGEEENFWSFLYSAAREYDAVRETGFFLDLCYRASGTKSFLQNATALFTDRHQQGKAWSSEYFHLVCTSDKTEQRAADRNTPEFSKKNWNYKLDLDVEDAKRFFDKHYQSAWQLA